MEEEVVEVMEEEDMEEVVEDMEEVDMEEDMEVVCCQLKSFNCSIVHCNECFEFSQKYYCKFHFELVRFFFT